MRQAMPKTQRLTTRGSWLFPYSKLASEISYALLTWLVTLSRLFIFRRNPALPHILHPYTAQIIDFVYLPYPNEMPPISLFQKCFRGQHISKLCHEEVGVSVNPNHEKSAIAQAGQEPMKMKHNNRPLINWQQKCPRGYFSSPTLS